MRTRQFLKLSVRQRQAYERAVDAVQLMRKEGLSLPAAAKEVGTDPRTVLRYARSALWQTARGQWRARREDNLLRQMTITAADGTERKVLVRGSREAQKITRWQSAVLQYQRSGDATHLRRLRHRTFVDAEGKRHRLITDPEQVRRWADRGLGPRDVEATGTV